MTARELTANQMWDDLVDRLQANDIRYLMGGSQELPAARGEAPFGPLILDLAP